MTSPRDQKTAVNGRCPTNRGSQAPDDVGRIYEEYTPRVAAYALRRTDRADAADVVAETFLVAWRRRDQIPVEPMVLPWLYGVARRVLANQHRARNRRTRLHDRLVTQFTHHQSPSVRVEVAEGFERVAFALRRLSDDDAEVLRLAAWEELSPSAIGEVLDIEPEAARQRLHRARKRLRKQLGIEDSARRATKVNGRTHSGSRPQPITALLWELSE